MTRRHSSTPKLPDLQSLKDPAVKKVNEEISRLFYDSFKNIYDDLTKLLTQRVTSLPTASEELISRFHLLAESGKDDLLYQAIKNSAGSYEFRTIALNTNKKGTDVASAAALTLGTDGDTFDITGTTGITSITAKPAGTVVKLQFDGVLTITDGSNLKLNGNFTTAAESTITLYCDGTNWFELARTPAVASTSLLQANMGMVWFDSVASIPSGWVICDGNNGTPNMTDRFVLHADADGGGTNNVGASGGASSVTLTAAQSGLPSHYHTIPSSVGGSGPDSLSGAPATQTKTTGSTGGTSASSSHTNRDKYYAYPYIKKT